MEIIDYLKAHEREILDDIFSLIKIPSVAVERSGDKPYGENCAAALDRISEIALREKLNVKNFDYYAVTATYGDEPSKLGILTHLDVVPEGDGWVFNPYFMTERDGRIYGRGTSDDKSAAIMSIWALKAIKEFGIPLKHGVRLVFGSGEEVGCKDLEYYISKEQMPPYVFSPDASFPIINTEKGRYCGKLAASYNAYIDGPQVVRFSGGSTINVVPQSSEAVVHGISEEVLQKALRKVKRDFKLNYSYEIRGKDIYIEFTGRSAHASKPHKGINAITAMLTLISILPLAGEAYELLKGINSVFPHEDYYGEAAGVKISDDISGNSTYSLDILKCENGRIDGEFDTRLSLNATKENTILPLREKLKKFGICLEDNVWSKAHHVDSESKFVKTLAKAYEKYTGLKSECISMGGISYVHNIDNAVAFGPHMENTDTHAHGPNEFMEIEEIIRGTAIYAQAIIDICL